MMPRLKPTSSSTPSATSAATSMALKPDAAMMIGTGARLPNARRPFVPSKSTLSPASSALTVAMHARISASVAALRPMVLAEVYPVPMMNFTRPGASSSTVRIPPASTLACARERIGDGGEQGHPRRVGRRLPQDHEGVARDHLAVEDAGPVEAGGLDALDQRHQLRHRRRAGHPHVDAHSITHGCLPGRIIARSPWTSGRESGTIWPA